MLIRIPDDILLRFPDLKISDVLSIQRAADNAERVVPRPTETTPATPRRKPGPKPGSAKKSVSKKTYVRAPDGAEDRVVDVIGSDAMSVADIVKATGFPQRLVARLLAKMREAGKLATEGKNRGMRYSVVQTYDHSPPANGAARSSHDVEADSLEAE